MNNENEKKYFEWEDNVGLTRQLIAAFQHVLTMWPSIIIVPILLSNSMKLNESTATFLISSSLFVAGIGVLIQTVGLGKSIGSKLPIVIGSSFVTVGPLISIGQKYGLEVVFGAVIAGGVAVFLLTFFMDRILNLFAEIVTGTFLTLVGINLAPNAIRDITNGVELRSEMIQNLLIGFGVVFIVIIVGKYGRGVFKSNAILVGIVVGCIASGVFGMINTNIILEAKTFELIVPFKYGTPKFEIGSTIIMIVFSIINIIQCIGAYSGLNELMSVSSREKTNGIRALSIIQIFSGGFNSGPMTMYNQNIGVLKITKVRDRAMMIMIGAILVIMGTFPKIAAVFASIPKPVMGGITLILLGTITATGLSILSKIDFSDRDNGTIVGVSLIIGVGITFSKENFDSLPNTIAMLFSNGLFVATMSAMILNYILNGDKKKESKKKRE